MKKAFVAVLLVTAVWIHPNISFAQEDTLSQVIKAGNDLCAALDEQNRGLNSALDQAQGLFNQGSLGRRVVQFLSNEIKACKAKIAKNRNVLRNLPNDINRRDSMLQFTAEIIVIRQEQGIIRSMTLSLLTTEKGNVEEIRNLLEMKFK
jgi:peptidoglycan hydrolase CwlO-like protein